MNPNWKFKIALCLFALYVIGINCDEEPQGKTNPEKSNKGENKNETFNFVFSKKVNNGTKDLDQIQCDPKELCEKVEYKTWLVNCTGKIEF